MKQTVVLGVTGGIAAYKTLELIKLLKQEGIEIFVSMTKHAADMINPAEFQKASGNKVYIDLFEPRFDYKTVLQERKVDHIELADKANLLVIAPATANVIAKLAYGMADDFLTTTTLATTAPIVICPSMNTNMWHNPIVQENVAKLKNRGFCIIEPTAGMLACGYEGAGRLIDIPELKGEIIRQLNQSTALKGQKIIVTTGGTREKIDAVRSITNRSSGKMGVAIAEECYLRGAEVLLLRARQAVTARYPIKEEVFTTAAELFALMQKYVPEYDYCYQVAAISDFTIDQPLPGKLSSQQPVTLRLVPQMKLIEQIKQLNPRIHLIGFKAEYQLSEPDLIQVALEKLKKTGADAIVANDIGKDGQGFEVDDNEAYVVFSDGSHKHLPRTSKSQLAKSVVSATTATIVSDR